MKKSFRIFFTLCVLFSCKGKKQLPPDVIPLNKMKVIVWEMEVADQQASDRYFLSKDSTRMEATSLYQQVFAKHKTGKADFYKSFTYYESNPDIMKVLFDSVSEYGNRQKAAAYKRNY